VIDDADPAEHLWPIRGGSVLCARGAASDR